MSDNAIVIKLSDVLGPDGLDGAWEAMVQKLADKAESKFLHAEFGQSFHAVAVNAINEAVEKRLADKLDELLSKPIYPTSIYGERNGEPTSFDAMIAKAVEDACLVTVDIYGKPSKSGSETLIQHALKRVALEQLSAAVKAEAKKVNAQAKEAVGLEVAKAIAAAIK